MHGRIRGGGKREYCGSVFLSGKGLDRTINNPLDKKMMANTIAAEAPAGRDLFCMNYLKAFGMMGLTEWDQFLYG